MYRPLLRFQSQPAVSPSSGYVCRQCRQHLDTARQQQSVWQHARYKSTAAAESEDQDWFGNLNSLSDDFGSQSCRRKKKAENAKKDEAKKEDRKEEGPDALALGDAAGTPGDKILETEHETDVSIHNPEKRARMRRRQQRRMREQKTALQGAKAQETQLVEGDVVRKSDSARKEAVEREGALSESEQNEGQRSMFERILAQDVLPRIRQQEAKEAQTKKLSEMVAYDDAAALDGLGSGELSTSRVVTGKETPRKIGTSSSERLEDTKLPASTPQAYSFGRKGPVSLAARARESANRPQWGGFTESKKMASNVSYDSLRNADRVSTEPMISTAGDTKPWGLNPSPKLFGATYSAAESEQPRTGSKEIERAKPAKQGILASMGAKTLRFLKRQLAQENSRTSTEIEPEPVQHRNPEASTQAASNDVIAKAVLPLGEDAQQTEDRKTAGDGIVDMPTVHTKTDLSGPLSWRQSHSDDLAQPKGQENLKLQKAEEAGVADKATSGEVDDSAERLAKLYERKIVGSDSEGDKKPISDSAGKARRRRARKGRASLAESILQKEKTTDTSLGVPPAEGKKERMILSEALQSSAVGSSSETPELEQPAVPAFVPPLPASEISAVFPSDLSVRPLNIKQPLSPALQYGLDRVLFNPGVYQLQDPHSRVYNFNPYLQKIMPIAEFDFYALKEYKTSSQDSALSALAKQYKKKYVGSTSSMTGALAHFHYLLSDWRELNLNMLSREFRESNASFTAINRSPSAIFLRHKGDGVYAIDADKEFDGANVLMMLGKSMEKLLTLPREQYERYKRWSKRAITEAEKEEPESFEYTTFGDLLMRSQLDAYDSRLPGTGTFDLKTRAVVSIRMDAENHEPMLGYEIHTLQGAFESYEREYYDMMRSTMLKYSLQARMGRMDGIFVAYHNIERLFGFQYLTIAELDRALHGQVDPSLGDQEFKMSLKLFNEVLEMATQKFPEKSLRFHFEAMTKPTTMMWVFAEPVEEDEVERIQGASKERVAEFERSIMGIEQSTEGGAQAEEHVTATMEDEGGHTSSNEATEPTAAADSRSASEKASEYTSSTAPADPAFYDRISSLSEGNAKPLFAATIICKSFVNDAPCPSNRPVNLSPSDKWRVEYILKEVTVLSNEEKRIRYEDCKTRRRKNLEKFGDEEIEGGEGRKENEYILMLKRMAERGRLFRKEVEEKESGSEKVVVGMPVYGGGGDRSPLDEDGAGEVGSQTVGDVEGYMSWLYGSRK